MNGVNGFAADCALRAVLALSVAAACGAVSAQDRVAPLPQVTISAKANRDPVEKSYRRMVRGMELFERRHALAPAAQLRFRLLPRQRDTDMRNIRLDVVGNTLETRVPIAPDDTFVLQRDPQALAEDAQVVPNRKARSMTWRTEIRSPGVPPDARRLGDLRLECEVGMEAGLVSEQRSLFDRLLGGAMRTPDYCNGVDPHYLFFSDAPLFGVTLVAGARREVLPVAQLYGGASDDPAIRSDLPFCDCAVLLDRSYYVPLGDRSWPDDTLVLFEPMAAGGDVAAAGTLAELAATLPQARVIRFDSGYQVWVDRSKPDRRDRREAMLTERIFLVDPNGAVTRQRTQSFQSRSTR